MLTGEQRRFITNEIYKQVNVILAGVVKENTTELEGIINLFPNMPVIEKRPVMHPYGYCSRAVDETIQVTAKQGENVGNRLILGHRDKARPKDGVEQGEMLIYASDGKKILRRVFLKKDKIQFGSKEADEPAVLGNVLRQFCRDWIDNWLDAPQIGQTPTGPCYLDKQVRDKFGELKQKYLDDNETNIISQDQFTERKAPDEA